MTTLRTYLQLVRLPAVFTAMADVFLGFVLAGHMLLPQRDVDFWTVVSESFESNRGFGFGLLLFASSCLYLAGMVFNDLFDREADALERPGRPIPSGRVSAKAATILGSLLVLVGIGAAFAVGRQSFFVAVILVGCIFLYNGVVKQTLLGPIAMGSCRSLNILLGASFVPAGAVATILARPQLPVAIAMGVYVAGVTWFARQEAQLSSRRQLFGATTVINLGLGGLAVLITGMPGLLLRWNPPGRTDANGVLMALAVIALILNRRLWAAIIDPVPGKVQPAVKTLLLSIIVLDAMLVFFHTNSPGYACMTAVLILPALVLGRWVFMT
jgi:4-hydroxybenzoate polyprenyltransferase